MSRPLRIVVIDDEPETARAILLRLDGVEVLHPRDVTEDHVQGAALLLVDHHFEPENWPDRSQYPITCRPQDGLALAAVMQSHLRSELSSYHSATAVALLSGKLHEVTGLSEPPEHLAALACGLDWAFAKTQSPGIDLASRVRSLADAVIALSPKWPDEPDKSRNEVARLLGLLDTAWIGIAMPHIDRCHPPVDDFARWTHGTAFIRWLAQRILPYRTFLMDLEHLAIRLGVTPGWLRMNLENENDLRRALTGTEYRGILQNFLGPRWWVAGVDTLLWQGTDGGSLDSEKVYKWLETQARNEPDRITEDATLILTENMRFDGATAPFSECVRVLPDDWPIFAEIPWTTIERARTAKRLNAVVLAADLDRLTADEA
jgi:hypothetical protein